jgi:hypothetical protein
MDGKNAWKYTYKIRLETLILLGCTKVSSNRFNISQTLEEKPGWNGELKESMCEVKLEEMDLMRMGACVRWSQGGPDSNKVPCSPCWGL